MSLLRGKINAVGGVVESPVGTGHIKWHTMLHICLQGEVRIIYLLLRANARLMSLSSIEGGPTVIAAMPINSGVHGDLRKLADRYGKTAATLAWDMQR